MTTPVSQLVFACVGGSVHAVDRTSGTLVWEVPLKGWLSASSNQMLVMESYVYVAQGSGVLCVFEAVTGKLVRATPFTGSGHLPSLLIDADRSQIFVTAGGELHAFDLDGTLLWTNTFSGKGNGAMSIAITG